MVKPTTKNPLRHLRATDLRSMAQLATQATVGVTRMAEGVHQSVWRTLGMPGGKAPGQARGVTGLIYAQMPDGARVPEGVVSELEAVSEAVAEALHRLARR